MQTEQAVDTSSAPKGRIRIEITADVNIGAPIAQRFVNIELMKKVGQMIMAGESEILVDGDRAFWKVPFLVVPPDDDLGTYPTGRYALVDAISGTYTLTDEEKDELKKAARPILHRLYPDLPEEKRKVREAKI